MASNPIHPDEERRRLALAHAVSIEMQKGQVGSHYGVIQSAKEFEKFLAGPDAPAKEDASDQIPF